MKMKLLRGYFRAKGLLEDFAKEERGGAEIIAIILIIGTTKAIVPEYFDHNIVISGRASTEKRICASIHGNINFFRIVDKLAGFSNSKHNKTSFLLTLRLPR